jgi:hypothetical protein
MDEWKSTVVLSAHSVKSLHTGQGATHTLVIL